MMISSTISNPRSNQSHRSTMAGNVLWSIGCAQFWYRLPSTAIRTTNWLRQNTGDHCSDQQYIPAPAIQSTPSMMCRMWCSRYRYPKQNACISGTIYMPNMDANYSKKKKNNIYKYISCLYYVKKRNHLNRKPLCSTTNEYMYQSVFSVPIH